MTSSRVLLDTNVLVYAMHPSDERHDACLAVLEKTRDAESAFCVTPQVLGEFYRVVTDARKVAVPRTTDEALAALDVLLSRPGLEVLPVPADLVPRWMNLLRRRPVTGRKLFDVILVATMLANDVTTVFTYNRTDFEPFHELEVVEPPAPK